MPIGVPGATSGSMFTPIPVEVLAYEPEVVGLDLLQKTKFTKLRHVEPIPDLARCQYYKTLHCPSLTVVSRQASTLQYLKRPNIIK